MHTTFVQRTFVLCCFWGATVYNFCSLQPDIHQKTRGCPHPVGVRIKGTLTVHCLDRQEIPLRSLLERHEMNHCKSHFILHTGDEAKLGSSCNIHIGSLPSSVKLTLGLPLSLNEATALDLQALPKIGPKLAKRIVTYRLQHGRFSTVQDLVKVKGIGNAMLRDLRPLIATKPSAMPRPESKLATKPSTLSERELKLSPQDKKALGAQ